MENNSVSSTTPPSPTSSTPSNKKTIVATLLVGGGAFLVLLFFSAIAALLVRAWHPGFNALKPTALETMVVSLFVEGPLIAYLLLALPAAWGTSLRRLGFRRPTWRDIGIAVVGGLAMIVVVTASADAVVTLLHSRHDEQAVAIFKSIPAGPIQILFIAFAIVLAPIFEELIFRVFLFNLILRFGGFWVAAILSAAAFGAAHHDLAFFLPLALGGLILAGVYYKTKNAWMSMVTHGVFNAASISGLLYLQHTGIK